MEKNLTVFCLMVGGGGDTIRLKASRGAQGAFLQILQNKMLNKIKQIA